MLRRRNFRFGLKGFLLSTAVIGAVAGNLGNCVAQRAMQSAAEKELRRTGGILIYASRFDSKIAFRDRSQLRHGVLRFVPLLRTVTDVRMTGCDVSEETLKHIAKLPSVRRVSLNKTNVNRGLNHLCKLSRLEHLDLGSTPINNDSLPDIARLEHLSSLNLGHTAITDDGIHWILALKQLHILGLQQTQVTPSGVNRLSRSLPQLHIYLGTK